MNARAQHLSASQWLSQALHPFLFVAFWALRGFNQLQQYAAVTGLITVLLLLWMLAYAIVGLLDFFIRDRTKASIIASFCLIIFLFYGEMQFGLIQIGWVEFSRYRFLLVTTTLLVAATGWAVWRTRKPLHVLNPYLNSIALVYVFIELFQIVSYKDSFQGHQYLTVRNGFTAVSPSIQQPRDIYYIILDSYTSQVSLQKYWGYDNSKFVNYLKGQGFYVADKARSNYNITIYSLASSLNMSYINVPSYSKLPSFAYRVLPMRALIQNSLVAQNFKKAGYEIVNLSLFDVLEKEKFYDYPLQDNKNLLWTQLIRKTLWGAMIANLYLNIDPQTPWKVARALPEISAQNSMRPRFVYAHFMIPHAPYLLDSQGKVRPFRARIGKASPEKDQQLYLEQLSFVNTLVMRVVDLILKTSSVPPIIILQGDHGSWCFPGPDGQQETTTILQALYLPGIDRSGLYDSLTPVNSFRFVMDHYLGTRYGILADEVFVVDEAFNVSMLPQ